jgi:Bacterial Ig-like domain
MVAAVLALGLLLAFAGSASAAPVVTIDSGPSTPTRDTMPLFAFTVDASALTIDCSIDQGTEAYVPCTSPYAPAAPLGEGDWTFRVRAGDGVEETVETQSFTVDTTAPTLSIDSGPTGGTNDRTPSFAFTTDASSAECSIDQGAAAYVPCASPYTPATPLDDGSYTFRVLATDAAGNARLMTQGFSVDATPPAVSIVSGPAGPTNARAPSFGFTVDGTATTVECSIDQGAEAYVPCASSYTPATPLGDGPYTFRVRAVDGLGNPTTRTQGFAIDSAAPSLSIDSGPAGATNDTTPSFQFSAEAGTTVACSIDQAPYGSCTSGTTYAIGTPLPEGTHTVRVRARDAGGNDAIVLRTFTVDTTTPSLSIGFGPSGTTSDATPLFGFSAEAGTTVECSIDQGLPAYRPCASTTTDAAVAPLADGAYVFRVRASDRAGNQTSVTRAFTVDSVPDAPGPPRPGPTPPAPPPVATPGPSAPQLLSPFPLVRISGTLTPRGARIRLLSVRASPGTLVRVTVSPACSKSRPASRRCRVLRAGGTVGRRAVIGFRRLAHSYRSGTVIVVRVWRADRIGKYTRFTIVRGKAPRRVDQCLLPQATGGSRCPSV